MRRLATREVVPTSEIPNFKGAGRTVDAPLLRLLGNLQKKHGESYASEARLREMIADDVGHLAGVDTIPCALERLQAQGVLEQRWLKPGGILPDGSVCTYGTRLVMLPQGRRSRRGLRVSASRREGVTHRYGARNPLGLDAARASMFKPSALPPELDDRQREADEKRERDLARLRDLAALWDSEGKPPPE